MNQRVFEYLWLDTNLRKALENDQLVIHYQPKITWRGEVRSLEALVRWQSPERGLIPPLEFISYAEESGLIVPLGRWVILDVVRQVAKWRAKGINLRVAVNVSARQLADQTLFTDLKQVLHELDFEYCPIDVELTESSLIENEQLALSVIQQFSQMGRKSIWMILVPVIRHCLNWPASHLMQLNWIKPLSGMYTNNLFRSRWYVPLLRSHRHSTCRSSPKVLKARKRMRFDQKWRQRASGFLFAKPMPAAAFERWYRRHLNKKHANAVGSNVENSHKWTLRNDPICM
jgi:cyclic di-GMP phosphodiesterase Gmr